VTEAATIRVLIADSDSATRSGVRLSLAGQGFEICAEAGDAPTAVAAARRERPDVCLMEVELPGDGIAAAELVTEALPRTKVVLLSSTADDESLFAALLAGVRGYLPKDMDPDRLPAVLRAVLQGEMALPRALTARVVDELRAARRGRHASALARRGVELSRRESGVLELLDRGLDTHAIARELGISAVTVRRHVSEIIRKLRVDDRAAALKLVREAPE